MPDRDALPHPGPRSAPPGAPGAAGTRTAYAVLAGGSGTRVGAATNKVYLPVAGLPVLSWSLRAADACPHVRALVLVARPADRELAEHAVHAAGPLRVPVTIVDGGATRHGSEQQALAAIAPAVHAGDIDLIAVHDGARPLASPALIAAVLEAAAVSGAALPAVAAPDVVPVGLLDGPGPQAPAPRPDARDEGQGDHGERPAAGVVAVQTPQAFAAARLLDVYARALREGFEGTDTASVWEHYTDVAVQVVPSSRTNLKVTYPGDLDVAARVLAG